MKIGKRRIMLIAICLLLAMPFTSGSTVKAKEIGDVVGQVLATDIQAYANGYPIPSMNVFGYTAVTVEDLRNYGFDVAWIPQQRRLVIHNRSGKQIEPIPISQTREEPGTKLADVLYTDIETFYGDTKIPSYNIDGKTAVLLNDLKPFGEVVWSEKERKLNFTPASAADVEHPEQSPLVLRQTDSITLEGIAFGDKEITYKNTVVGRILNGKPLMSVLWMAKQFGYSVKQTDDGYEFNNGTYSFQMHPGEKQIKRFWFGSSVGDNNLFLAPVRNSDGVLLAYETDLKHLFGYYSVWDPETRKLNMLYRKYVVEDYGLPDSLNTYFFTAKVNSYISGIDADPTMLVNNRINGNQPIYGGSSGESVQDADGNGPNFRLISDVPVDFGHNDINLTLTKDWRILFHKSLSVDLSMKQVESKIDYSKLPYSFGDYSVLKSITPKQAYIQTTSNSFEATGVVLAKNGNGLTFMVEVQEGDQYRKISEQKVPFDQDTFAAKLTLPDAPGLYRITAVSLVTNPRNTTTIPVAKWYVDKGSK